MKLKQFRELTKDLPDSFEILSYESIFAPIVKIGFCQVVDEGEVSSNDNSERDQDSNAMMLMTARHVEEDRD